MANKEAVYYDDQYLKTLDFGQMFSYLASRFNFSTEDLAQNSFLTNRQITKLEEWLNDKTAIRIANQDERYKIAEALSNAIYNWFILSSPKPPNADWIYKLKKYIGISIENSRNNNPV